VTSRRRKKSNRKLGVIQSASGAVRRRLEVTLGSLEIIEGRDGLFRGKPEPAMVVAAYRVGNTGLALLGRISCVVEVRGTAPIVCSLGDQALRYDSLVHPGERYVVLATALELDAGRGLVALQAQLEQADAIALWSLGDSVPEPRSLVDFAARPFRAPAAAAVELLVGSRPAADIARDDDLVSSCAFAFDGLEEHDEAWRLPFADAARHNAWCASLRTCVR
jgi:hypothetical protein